MRSLASAIVAIGALLAMASASAQTYDPNYPVCMQVTEMFGGTHFDCSFTSIPQCRASARGLPATCLINPYFASPYPEPPGRVSRQHRRIY
ncbi:MAG: DUF3551 domain-containing protein [Bradyrhizobium sp.]